MKPRTLLATLVFLCVGAALSWGATTGSISGVITDAQTGEPVIGVTVMVMGTNLGSSTDVDGHYTVLNVSVGTYTLRLSSVGYATVEISNVAVSVDLTTYWSQTMSSEATDIGTTIRVVAETPLVIPDKVASIQIIRANEILALPTRGFEEVVGIQAGVVASIQTLQGGRSNREATNTAELFIRGGRQNEVAYYVDGFSQQDPLSGTSTGSIANNAIQEISVVSGGFPAEYGHVASGVVKVTTKSGGEELSGEVEAVTDQRYGRNWYSAAFGGPVPGLAKARFYGSAERRYQADRNPSARTSVLGEALPERFEHRLPNNWLEGWSFTGRFDYDFNANMKLALGGNRSRDEWQQFQQSKLFQSEHNRYYNDYNLGLNAKWTHTLSANTFYNLSGSYFVTERFRGDGVHRGDLFAYGRVGGNGTNDAEGLFRAWDNMDSITPTEYVNLWVSIDTATMVDSTVGGVEYTSVHSTDSIQYRFVDRGDETQIHVGSTAGFLKRKSEYIGIKGDITSELSKEHTVKAGFEFDRHTLRRYHHLDPIQVWDGLTGTGFRNANRYGYDILGNESDDEPWYASTKHPIDLGLYAQDRIEYRGLIVTAGVRFDYFDYKALQVRDTIMPMNPDSLGEPGFPPADASITKIDRTDLDDSEAFTRVSPRLGVSFPVSDRTQMRVSYGKFFQRPNLEDLYVGFDYMGRVLMGNARNTVFGNPNLQPPKTTGYEIGLTHQMGDNISFDVNIFYRETEDLVVQANIASLPKDYQTYVNSDYGTIKGLEFNLKSRRVNHLMFDIKYTLQYANGTGSFSSELRNVQWVKTDTPRQTQPLAFDQRHKMTGVFDVRFGAQEGPKLGDYYILENFGLNVLLNASSGLPYTPVFIEGYNEIAQISIAPTPRDVRNSSNRPWMFSIDLKMERAFNFDRFKLVPYLWVKNLLDRDNPINVWEGTGRADAAGWLETDAGKSTLASFPEPTDNSGLNYEEKYHLLEQSPTYYSNPRQIMFGLRVSF